MSTSISVYLSITKENVEANEGEWVIGFTAKVVNMQGSNLMPLNVAIWP